MAPETALICGGTGGIGSALCRRLIQRGTKVLAVARDAAPLRSLQAELPSLHILSADLVDEQEMQRTIEQAQQVLGQIRSAAYCVGSMLLRPAHLTTTEQFNEVIQLNLFGAFSLIRALTPVLSEQGGGSLLFFSSAAASFGMPNHEAIAAAKGGLEAMIRSAAMSYAKHGIRINAIAPGLLKTPMTDAITKNENSLRISQGLHPTGRIGTPEDVLGAAEWLMGPESSWVTGSVVNIDGGLSAGRTV